MTTISMVNGYLRLTQIEVKPVMLKDELMSQTQVKNTKNHGARGKHTFDDDDDDLELDGDDTGSRAEKSLSTPISQYYMGFDNRQHQEEGQEEQIYGLLYNYDGAGSNAGSKNSEDADDQRADHYPNSKYNDGLRHYSDTRQEEKEKEQTNYISKNKAYKSDYPSPKLRQKESKSSTSSYQQPQNSKTRQITRPEPSPKDDYSANSKPRRNNTTKDQGQSERYYNNSQGYEKPTPQPQAKKTTRPPQNQSLPVHPEDLKAPQKLKPKQIYYVSKGESSKPQNESYTTRPAEPDYDYQGSYDDYNYDSGHRYPVSKPNSSPEFQPPQAYNSHQMQPKPAPPKQPAYTSKDAPLHRPSKDILYQREEFRPEAGYYSYVEDKNLGSYNYNQPTQQYQAPEDDFATYYTENPANLHYSQQAPAEYVYGGETEHYNLYPEATQNYSNRQDLDYNQAKDVQLGSQLLQKFYAAHRTMNGMQTHQAPTHNGYDYQAVKVLKPSRGGQN